MAVYREPKEWVEEAIYSVLQQTYQNFEFIIIVDDPANTEIVDLILRIYTSDTRIKLLVNEVNLGLTKSLNIGLRHAKGKYIARMDADDICYLTRLEKQYDLMEAYPEIVACGTAIKKFGNSNETVMFEADSESISSNFTRPNPHLSPIAHPTAFIRTSILSANKIKYDENFKTGQDYALWSELLFRGKLTNLKEVLLAYRTSDFQITSKKRKDQLNVVNYVIENHIRKWGELQNIQFDNGITPYAIKAVRENKKHGRLQVRLDSFIFGLLLNSKYDWFYCLVYFLKDLRLNVPVISKIRLIVRKLRD